MSEVNEPIEAPSYDDSILRTIKKMLGLDIDYEAFDTDIIVLINSALMTLQQLGVGRKNGFVVTGLTQMWSDFLPSDTMLEGVKHYIMLRVKMVFDPPQSSYVMETMKQEKEELEWRLREQAEFYPGDGSRLGYYEQQNEGRPDRKPFTLWQDVEDEDEVLGFFVIGGDKRWNGLKH